MSCDKSLKVGVNLSNVTLLLNKIKIKLKIEFIQLIPKVSEQHFNIEDDDGHHNI